MSWTYMIRSGALSQGNTHVAFGYSGYGPAKNRNDMVSVKHTGPIPPGIYTIGKPYKHTKLGPVCMNLEPDAANEMFGRSLFRIHGDNKENNASHGCIIMDRKTREKIAASNDTILRVIP